MDNELKVGSLTFSVKSDNSMSEDDIAIIDWNIFDRLRYRIEFEQAETVIDGDVAHCKFNIGSYFWLAREVVKNAKSR